MKKDFVLRLLEFACRLGIGALFIYSALSKVSDPDEFAYSVSRYRFLPDFTVGLFSLTMPMLELLVGLSMLFTKWLRESALLVTVMLVMFIIALSQALARGLEISCGCFGVPSMDGRDEMIIALARDVVLIVPAVWLMSRPNSWMEPLVRMSKVWRAICLCGAGALLAAWFVVDTPSVGLPGRSAASDSSAADGSGGQGQGLVVSSGPIRPGEWNYDFEGVLARAERERRPMILLQVLKGCRQCSRLEESLEGEAFRLWRENRAPLMAFVRGDSHPPSSGTAKAAADFVHGINPEVKGYPYVCVYWPHGSTTNSVAFCGRRGKMGGRTDKLLVVEFMSALDIALGDWRVDRRMPLESIIGDAALRVSARVDGGGGTVTMRPNDGILLEGKQVELFARPDDGYAFLDWHRPDGSLASMAYHIVVRGGMPVGCYTARFKKRSECLPPELLSPEEETLRVRVGERLRYEIKVSESCRPVSFKAEQRLPVGMNLDTASGLVSGIARFAGSTDVTIAVVGNDPDRTQKTVHLVFIVDSGDDAAE